MISPHTPPGTIVRLDLDTKVFFHLFYWTSPNAGKVGALGKIHPEPRAASGYIAEVSGMEYPCDLEALSIVELPSCLTDCLNTEKLPEDAKELEPT